MKNKKIKRYVAEAIQEEMSRFEIPYPPISACVGNEADAAEGESILQRKMEEAKRNDAINQMRHSRDAEYWRNELAHYKKELDRAQTARKKFVEQQQKMMYSVKDLSQKQKSMDKSYQKQLKDINKELQALKTSVKKKTKKQKKERKLMEYILKQFAVCERISCYDASLKEIAHDCKKAAKHRGRNYIDAPYREISSQ